MELGWWRLARQDTGRGGSWDRAAGAGGGRSTAAQDWEELCGGGGWLDRIPGGGGDGTGFLAVAGGGWSTAAQVGLCKEDSL